MLEPPCPFGGAAGRWYYVLYKELLKRSYDVHAFAACSSMENLKEARKLFPEQTLRLYSFPQRKGLQKKIHTLIRPFSYMFDDQMIFDIHQELEKGCDIIHLEQMWSAWTIIDDEKFKKKALLNVHYLSSIDLEFTAKEELKEKITVWLMKRTEKMLAAEFPFVRAITPRLKNKLHEWNPQSQHFFSPFGIDPSLYEYINDSQREINCGGSKTISLIASMNWYPGLSAAKRLLENLWPELKKMNPDAKLQIVGWGARTALKNYLNLPDIEILENVPSIQEYFEKSSLILYAPERGSGVKIKILEAMLFGIPVVTTSEGVEGIDYKNGIHALVGETDQELITLAHQLLNNKGQQKNIRVAARKLIENNFSPESTVNALEQIYDKILSRGL